MTTEFTPYENTPNIAYVGGANLIPVPVMRANLAIAEFTKLQNRATKRLGILVPTFEIAAKGIETRRQGDDTKSKLIRVPMVYFRVHGARVKLAGWEFAAKVEPVATGNGGMIVSKAPAFTDTLPDVYRDESKGMTCEHCGHIRRRKKCYVLRHDDGTWIQVGSTCLRDFLGHNPEQALRGFDSFYEFESKGRDAAREWFPEIYDSREFLAVTSGAIRVDGWIAKSSYSGNPTVYRVFSYFDWKRKPSKFNAFAAAFEPEESDYERADKALDWIRTVVDTSANKNDYEHNLCLALAGDALDGRLTGIAASGIAAYMREMNRMAEIEKRKEVAKISEFVGDIKERLRDLPVTIDHVKYLSNDYGPVTLIKFRDNLGNVLSWFASGDFNVAAGDKKMLTGTVKKHNDWQGLKETMLTRCKMTPRD